MEAATYGLAIYDEQKARRPRDDFALPTVLRELTQKQISLTPWSQT